MLQQYPNDCGVEGAGVGHHCQLSLSPSASPQRLAAATATAAAGTPPPRGGQASGPSFQTFHPTPQTRRRRRTMMATPLAPLKLRLATTSLTLSSSSRASGSGLPGSPQTAHRSSSTSPTQQQAVWLWGTVCASSAANTLWERWPR